MNTQKRNVPFRAEWGLAESKFVVYVLLAGAVLAPVTILLDSPFPIFTVIWLVVPFIAVALILFLAPGALEPFHSRRPVVREFQPAGSFPGF